MQSSSADNHQRFKEVKNVSCSNFNQEEGELKNQDGCLHNLYSSSHEYQSERWRGKKAAGEGNDRMQQNPIQVRERAGRGHIVVGFSQAT